MRRLITIMIEESGRGDVTVTAFSPNGEQLALGTGTSLRWALHELGEKLQPEPGDDD